MAKSPQVRKEATNFRLEPIVKYTAEIAARVQRKNLTTFLEWSMSESFKNLTFDDGNTIASQMDYLWDIDEADRFIKLAYTYPRLLTYDEQHLLKVINENFSVFKKDPDNFMPTNKDEEAAFKANIPMLAFIDFKKVRDRWTNLNNYIKGEEPLDLS